MYTHTHTHTLSGNQREIHKRRHTPFANSESRRVIFLHTYTDTHTHTNTASIQRSTMPLFIHACPCDSQGMRWVGRKKERQAEVNIKKEADRGTGGFSPGEGEGDVPRSMAVNRNGDARVNCRGDPSANMQRRDASMRGDVSLKRKPRRLTAITCQGFHIPLFNRKKRDSSISYILSSLKCLV